MVTPRRLRTGDEAGTSRMRVDGDGDGDGRVKTYVTATTGHLMSL